MISDGPGRAAVDRVLLRLAEQVELGRWHQQQCDREAGGPEPRPPGRRSRHRGDSSRPSGATRNMMASIVRMIGEPTRAATQPTTCPSDSGPGPSFFDHPDAVGLADQGDRADEADDAEQPADRVPRQPRHDQRADDGGPHGRGVDQRPALLRERDRGEQTVRPGEDHRVRDRRDQADTRQDPGESGPPGHAEPRRTRRRARRRRREAGPPAGASSRSAVVGLLQRPAEGLDPVDHRRQVGVRLRRPGDLDDQLVVDDRQRHPGRPGQRPAPPRCSRSTRPPRSGR